MFGIGSIVEPDTGEDDVADISRPKNDEEETRAWYAWTYEGGSNWITIWEARYWLLGTLLVGGCATYVGVLFLHSMLLSITQGAVTWTLWLFMVAACLIFFLYCSTGSSTESPWTSALSSVGSG